MAPLVDMCYECRLDSPAQNPETYLLRPVLDYCPQSMRAWTAFRFDRPAAIPSIVRIFLVECSDYPHAFLPAEKENPDI